MPEDTYATEADAIYNVLAPTLDVPGDTDVNDFDAHEIFKRVFTWDEKVGGYRQTVKGREFWAIVHKFAL